MVDAVTKDAVTKDAVTKDARGELPVSISPGRNLRFEFRASTLIGREAVT